MSSKPFFRADQVGSLLRPAELLAARERHAKGEIDDAALHAAEDAAIADAVAKQEKAGLPVIMDGEFRRENFWIDFIRGIDGLTIAGADDVASFSNSPSGTARYAPKWARATGKIRHGRVQMKDDYEYLAGLTDRTVKITVPSPTRAHVLSGDKAADPEIYPNIDDYWDDLAGVYRAEIAGLEALGCRYIQIDEPYFSSFIDEKQRAHLEEIHGDTDPLIARYVDVLNECVRDRSPETNVALHICRGNARSTWFASGGYGAIADSVLAKIDVDSLLLEYDDERSGDFAPLAKVKSDVTVVLGLLTTKSGDLENIEALKARIDDATEYVPLERLAVSPQCGFASVAEGNLLSEDDEWRKLALVVETAQAVWGTA